MPEAYVGMTETLAELDAVSGDKVRPLEADGYLLLHGSGYVISKQHVHPNGTVQITLKKLAPVG